MYSKSDRFNNKHNGGIMKIEKKVVDNSKEVLGLVGLENLKLTDDGYDKLADTMRAVSTIQFIRRRRASESIEFNIDADLNIRSRFVDNEKATPGTFTIRTNVAVVEFDFPSYNLVIDKLIVGFATETL